MAKSFSSSAYNPTVTLANQEQVLGSNSNIENLSLPIANTEVSQALSADTRSLTIRCRQNAVLQFSFVSTESATKYLTIPVGTSYVIDNLDLTSKTLYIQSPTAGVTVEILEIIL
jgi:hypothetical protein